MADSNANSLRPTVFDGLLSSDGAVVNLNPEMAQQMGLRFGDVIQIECDGQSVEAYFVADAEWAVHWLFLPTANSNGSSRAIWTVTEEFENQRALWIQAWSGSSPRLPPVKKERKWRPANVTRISKPSLVENVEVSTCVVKGSSIRALVLICLPTVLVLNVDRQSLAAIGCQPDETSNVTMSLCCGSDKRRLVITNECGNWGARRHDFYCEIGDNARNQYATLKKRANLTNDDPNQFIATVGVEIVSMLKLQRLLDDLSAQGAEKALAIREFPRPLDLLGALHRHWVDDNREILCIETLAYARDQNWHSIRDKRPTNHELALSFGDEVVLAMAPPT